MIRINLSGIQSLNIPPALFDEFLKRNGGAIKGAAYPEGFDIWCEVIHDRENRFQTEHEPAIKVILEGCTIGYVPVLSRIRGYIQKARDNNDLARYERETARYRITEFIRESIEREMFVYRMPVRAKLGNVMIDYDTGAVLSVSVDFDYN